MQCNKCLQDALEETSTNYKTTIHDCTVGIYNLPCLKCTNCGHELFTVQAMTEIETITDAIEHDDTTTIEDLEKIAHDMGRRVVFDFVKRE